MNTKSTLNCEPSYLHYAQRGFCRFRDDTAADIASSRTNAASPIARVSQSREARVTDLPDKTLHRAALLSDHDIQCISYIVYQFLFSRRVQEKNIERK